VDLAQELAMKKLLVSLALCLPAVASATPHPLPFSYTWETLNNDQLEVEQYVDLTPVKLQQEQADGTLKGVFDLGSTLITEIEYGLTDRIEGGFYFQFKQDAGGQLGFDGIKQRLRFRLGQPGGLDVGLYIELAELHDEIELEEKLLLQYRTGKLNFVANLWIEQEYEFQKEELELVANPTAGVVYQFSPKFLGGIEYWGRGKIELEEEEMEGGEEAPFVHYLGPTFLAQRGNISLSLGAYLRLDNLGDGSKVDDPFGKLWFRTLLAVQLQ
jgi:hypothetical protein